MANEVGIELICKAEDKLVGRIAMTGGLLSAAVVVAGLEVVDVARCPPKKIVKDGVQLTCARCHEALFFRAADGEPFAAMPGSVEVQP